MTATGPIIGTIGASGVGRALFEAIRGFYYAQATAILPIVAATMTVMEMIPQFPRRRII